MSETILGSNDTLNIEGGGADKLQTEYGGLFNRIDDNKFAIKKGVKIIFHNNGKCTYEYGGQTGEIDILKSAVGKEKENIIDKQKFSEKSNNNNNDYKKNTTNEDDIDDDDEIDDKPTNKYRKRNDPLNRRILENDELNSFLDSLKKVSGIKVNKRGNINVRDFKKKKNKEIAGRYLVDSDGNKFFLSNSITRAAILNDAESIVNNLTGMESKKSGLRFKISVEKCLRYVGYLGLAQILEKCKNCTYNDVASGKLDKLRDQVDDCLKFLNLEDSNELNTKHNLSEAMNIWTEKFDALKRDIEKHGLEAFQNKYRNVSNDSPTFNLNNRGRKAKRWIAV